MTAVLLALLTLQPADMPWPETLSTSWGPHGSRIPVSVRNAGATDVEGQPVDLTVGEGESDLPLAGQPVAEVRVTDDTGMELLYAVVDPNGLEKRTGDLEVGDHLVVPASAPAGGERTLYVYFGCPGAWPVADWLAGGLRNTGFESAAGGTPSGWLVSETDSTHRMSWSADEGRDGSACAKCVVEAGAEPTWVKHHQTEIPVAPGTTYRLRAWVRAESVAGGAGWFLHINGVRPQLVNQVLSAGDGTYDWREVELEVTAPEGSQTATIGTMLHGTGAAWYDDLTFEAVGGAETPQVTIGARQKPLALRTIGGQGKRGWGQPRVVVRNGGPAREALISADTRTAELRYRRETGDFVTPLAARLTVPEPGEALDSYPSLGGLTLARLPERSELACLVSVRSSEPQADGLAAEDSRRLAAAAANLAGGGLLDAAEDLVPWGAPEAEGADLPSHAEVVPDGPGGTPCLRLTIPKETAPNWTGVRQGPMPIEPGKSYYYGALVRAGDLGAEARIHAHIHDAAGTVLNYLSSASGVAANSDWTWLAIAFTAPTSAADVVLHLTANTWGTIYYDNVALCEVVRGSVTLPNHAVPHAGPPSVAVVPPLVKVFPHDVYRTSARSVELASARNEREAFQLAVAPSPSITAGPNKPAVVSVEVSALTGPGGAALPPVKVERVGYVPVDAPTAYYRSEVPAYARKLPQGAGASDGWAGHWPDPLIPVEATVEIPRGETTPFWFTVKVPKDAAPGEYAGEVMVATDAGRTTVPVTLTVWDFELPDATHTRAIYDLRDGPIGKSVFGTDDPDACREAWYRLLADYRVTPDIPGPAPVFTLENGEVRMDATEFDRWATLCLDELGMNHLYTPWEFYCIGWASDPGPKFGFEAFSPEYERALGEAYRLLIDHLTEKGWRDRLIHYVSDEPFFDHEKVVDDLRRYGALFEEWAPDVPRYSSAWRPAESLEGAITMWGAGHYGCFPVEKLRERLAAGDRALFTTDGQMCIDTPYLAVERLLPHYCFHYGVEGYEFWGVSWWTYDPWEFGWHSFIRQNDGIGEDYYVRYPDGDGYLAYPGERYGVNGPLPSIRLAQAREGLEDGEYLILLRDLAARLPEDSPEAVEARAALAESAALVPIPNSGGLRSSYVLPDPTVVERVRLRLGNAISACRQALREG